MFKDFADLFTAPAPDLELKASGDGRIEGLASPFGGDPDTYGDVVEPGAFKASLTRRKASGDLPVMLWSHNLDAPVGRWSDFEERSDGLHVRGNLNLKTAAGRDAFEHVKAGDARGLSIGYRIPEGGREYVGQGIFLLKEVDLFEVSIVTIPAASKARITELKTIGSKAEAIDMLRKCGLSRQAAARFAAGGFKALAGEDTHEKAIKLAAALDRATKLLRNDR